MYKKILLPLDLQETELSARATKVAQDLAKFYGARITVLTVIPDFGMPLVANFFPPDAIERAETEAPTMAASISPAVSMSRRLWFSGAMGVGHS